MFKPLEDEVAPSALRTQAVLPKLRKQWRWSLDQKYLACVVLGCAGGNCVDRDICTLSRHLWSILEAPKYPKSTKPDLNMDAISTAVQLPCQNWYQARALPLKWEVDTRGKLNIHNRMLKESRFKSCTMARRCIAVASRIPCAPMLSKLWFQTALDPKRFR